MMVQNKNFSLSIITITKDNDKELIKTLASIQNQRIYPHEVIVKDGISRNKPKFLDKYNFDIIYISSNDYGIYDAMNIALRKVNSEYILFLNSGDNLYDERSILNFYNLLNYNSKKIDNPDIIFFSWIYMNYKKIYRVRLKPLRFNHQAVIYKTELHRIFGPYIAQKSFSTADYFFFRYVTLSKNLKIELSDKILSIINPNGISSSLKTFFSVALINYLLGMNSKIFILLVGIFHPIYYFIKKRVKFIKSIFE